MIDPSKITPEELFKYVTDMVTAGYEEIPTYTYVMSDLLTVGTVHFAGDLARTRGWNNRVLGLMQQARQIKAAIARQALAQRRFFELGLAEYLQQAKKDKTEPLKGLDANERKMLARAACANHENEADRWDQLVGELRAYIDLLEDKHKDLLVARNDLRAQLWAVRLHGVLGELAREGQEMDGDGVPGKYKGIGGLPGLQDQGRVQVPLAGRPPTNGEAVVDRDTNIDDLLAGVPKKDG